MTAKKSPASKNKKSSASPKAAANGADTSPKKANVAKLEWSLDVPAHMATYFFLIWNEGLVKKFSASKDVKLRTLDYWNSAGGGMDNDTRANGLAERMVDEFANRVKVSYEAGHNGATASDVFFHVARNGDSTVRQLADAVDTCFDFLGEPQ